MERRPRRTKSEKLQEELQKTEDAIKQYTAAIAAMEKKRDALLEELDTERVQEVTKLMKEKNLSIDQLKQLLGEINISDAEVQGVS